MAVGENMVKLVDEQKREKEAAVEMTTQLLAELDYNHALELKILQIRELVEVLKLMIDEGPASDKFEALEQQLKNKEEQLAGIL